MSNNPSPYGSAANQEPSKTSGVAIASLVLGLFSFLTCLFTGLPAIALGIVSLVNINNSGGRLRGRGLAIAGIVTGSIGSVLTIVGMVLMALLLPTVQNARDAGRQAVSMNNMCNIATCMLSYESAEGHLPDRASLSADGKPLLSWRVYLLPDLGQSDLFKQFHLDEPWDSPHNRTLIDLMPSQYASPNDPSDSKTLYLVPYGPGTIYDGTKAKSLAAIIAGDGLSDTILLIEADLDKQVTWTKPDDWEFDPADPSAGLGKLRGGKFVAAMADARVRVVPTDLGKKKLAALFTTNGGEAIPPF
jgi:hypothetical protein